MENYTMTRPRRGSWLTRRTWLPLYVSFLAGAAPIAPAMAQPAEGARAGETAPAWVLSSPTGRSYKSSEFSGKPLVMVLSDVGGRAELKKWYAQLEDISGLREKALAVTVILDTSDVPGFGRGRANAALRKNAERVNATGAILLEDAAGKLQRPYALKSGTVNIVLVDGKGVIRFKGQGDDSTGLLRDLNRNLAVLREEAKQP